MKILKFLAENIKGLKVVSISPEGNDVVISGKNGAGKSSILTSIENTLCGGDLPVRSGEEKGSVEIDIGDFVIQRVITQKTDRLIVKNKDGASYPSPRNFLDKFIGQLSIDPTSFIKLKSKDQMDVIFKMFPELKEVLKRLDDKVGSIKQERTILNKNISRLKFEIEKIPECLDAPKEEVSVSELHSILSKVIEGNKKIESVKDEIEKLELEGSRIYSYKKELEERIEKLKIEIGSINKSIEDVHKKIADKKNSIEGLEVVDEKPIVDSINSASEKNKKYESNKKLNSLKSDLTNNEDEYFSLGEELKQIEQEKIKVFEGIDLPIKNLLIEDDVLKFNGVPVSDLSTSEKVKLGAYIAVAQNPKAKIILVDDASLLDSENVSVLREICKDFQIWQVVNDESGNKGIYIEEGEVKK